VRSRWKTLLTFCCGIVLLLAWTRPADSPRLVILISMDQMRADYFDRFADEFTGGLKRLSREGLVYANASLNYASSETGPGHATLATGSYPRTHGILSNEWCDRGTRQEVYCVDDTAAKSLAGEGGKVSSKNLRVTAFGDWLKAASPQSKVISMAVKDRAAVLMGGQRPNEVFWYTSKSGHMATSDYYVKTVPEWVKQFNASNWVEAHVPASWTKLEEDSVYAKLGPDEMAGEFVWGETTTFPHVFLPERKKNQMLTSPWGDMLILDFATAAIHAEKLGQRGQTDFLAVGLSCTDYVGHAFGPHSHEILDHLLRVDRALGEFLKFVDQAVGKGKYVVALSADHGVLPLPEYLSQIEKQNARRIISDRELKPQIESMLAKLQQEIGTQETLIQQNAFLNYAAAAKHGIDSLTLENKIREGALQIDGIADVYFGRELLDDNTPDRPYLGHFRRSYFAQRGEDIQVRYCENCLISSRPTGTTHGSTYRYDTHVPVIFFGQSIPTGRVQREVHTVDVAPTLAKILEVPYPATVEGMLLEEIVR
jgi:predicted AlkP superfamily pyrophosphatase or phosphodiesterase